MTRYEVKVYGDGRCYKYVTNSFSITDEMRSCNCFGRTKPEYSYQNGTFKRYQKCKFCGKEKTVEVKIL